MEFEKSKDSKILLMFVITNILMPKGKFNISTLIKISMTINA